MATISKRDQTLVVELSALEKAEAMHGDLEIPTAAISSVEVLEDAIHQIHGLRPSGLKITGTYLPGKMAMGTYLAGLHRRPVFAVSATVPSSATADPHLKTRGPLGTVLQRP